MMSKLKRGRPTLLKQVTWLCIIWTLSVLVLGSVSLLLRSILKN
ncbi:DUF2474 family protein [Polynucleobacter asymbioticus]